MKGSVVLMERGPEVRCLIGEGTCKPNDEGFEPSMPEASYDKGTRSPDS